MPIKHPRQPGLFDVEEQAAQLTEMDNPLVDLSTRIDWVSFRPELNRIHEKGSKSKAGAKPYYIVLVFKLLLPQQLRNLSRLKELNLLDVLFSDFHQQLSAQSYIASCRTND